MFIMVDGIDGSGKSSVIDAWKEYLTAQGNTIFDLRDTWKKRGAYPEYSELKSYDFIFSGEPTYVGVGKVIREELIAKNNNYTQNAIAEAYALDRLVLYKKIIIPALEDGKCVIQDRGVSTSLCYQTVGDTKLSFEEVAALEGNALALAYAPNHLVLIEANTNIAIERLSKRLEKQDNVIFEKNVFLEMASAQFKNPAFLNLFKERNTAVHYLSGNDELGIMKHKSIDLLKQLLS